MKGQGSASSWDWRGKGERLYPRGPAHRGAPRIDPLHLHQEMAHDPTQPPTSYEAALEELEKLVQVIESGQLPLEQLLSGYKRGAELLAFCRGRLDAVEHQIQVLDDGALKPWTPQ